MREPPTFDLMDRFEGLGAEIAYHDPFIPVITPTREHAHWQGHKSVAWDKATISKFDVVVISTWHNCFDADQLTLWTPLIVDTRNALGRTLTKQGQCVKA